LDPLGWFGVDLMCDQVVALLRNKIRSRMRNFNTSDGQLIESRLENEQKIQIGVGSKLDWCDTTLYLIFKQKPIQHRRKGMRLT